MNGLRYITDDLLTLERMTIREYNLRMKVRRLKDIDRLKGYVEQAFVNRMASATKGQGRSKTYKFESPNDMFDFEKMEDDILFTERKRGVFNRLRLIASNVREYNKDREARDGDI